MPAAPRSSHTRLAVEALEDRTTPTFLPRPGGPLGQQLVVNGATVPTGGLSIAVGDLIPDSLTPFGLATNEYVTGTGPGTQALVRVYSQDGTLLRQFAPFGNFQGGINVAVGHVIDTPTQNDLFGDPIVEQQIVVAVAGNGPPHVKVYSAAGRQLASFMAFDTGFAGGLNIAVGNVLGGVASGGLPNNPANVNFLQEIIIGAASGGSPHVVVTDGGGTVVRSFLAFDLGFRGGVTVAAGDIDTDATLDFLTGASSSDTNAYDEIIVGSATGTSHVKAFEVYTGAITERLSFFAFSPGSSNGVTLTAGGTDGNRGAEIYVGQIGGSAQPSVRVFGDGGQQRAEFRPFPALYSQVVNLALGNLSAFGGGSVYDPSTTFADSGQDLVVVAGDGPFGQQPRFYFGGFAGIVAGQFGP